MKRDWLAALIEGAYNARNVIQKEEQEEAAIEIVPELLAELEADTFVSGKLFSLLIPLGKNGKGVFMLQKKARERKRYVRGRQFEVELGVEANSMPQVKRVKPNLDMSFILGEQLDGEIHE